MPTKIQKTRDLTDTFSGKALAEFSEKGASPSSGYVYRKSDGEVAGAVVRFDVGTLSPEKQFRQYTWDGQAFVVGGFGRRLWRLPDLLKSTATVFLVEGEKCVLALQQALDAAGIAGVVTTTNGGSSGWHEDLAEYFRDREVVILADNDKPGKKHAEKAAADIGDVATSVKVIDLPGLGDGEDIADWLQAGHKVSELQELLKDTEEYEPPESEDRKSSRDNAVEQIMSIVEDADFFNDERERGFTRIEIDGVAKVLPLRGREFGRLITAEHFHIYGRAPRQEHVQSVLDILEAQAAALKIIRPLDTRFASDDGGNIWIDLHNQQHQAIKVTPEGWGVVDDPPPLFRRHSHMLELPIPVRGGSIKDLSHLLPALTEDETILIIVWLVCAMIPGFSHPMFMAVGPQGSAKTTLAKIMRGLIDPTKLKAMPLYSNEEDMVLTLSQHAVPLFDNISQIRKDQADFLCRAITGGAFQKRKHYEDEETVIFAFQRPILATSICIPTAAPDLLDRSLVLLLKRIERGLRRSEASIWEDFERLRAGVLGGLLDLLVMAMKIHPSIPETDLPRMADFALWGMAITQAMGHPAEKFLEVLKSFETRQLDHIISEQPVAAAIIEFMSDKSTWEGTPTELFSTLSGRRTNVSDTGWPRAASVFSKQVQTLAATLMDVGIHVEYPKGRKNGRKISISRRPSPSEDSKGTA